MSERLASFLILRRQVNSFWLFHNSNYLSSYDHCELVVIQGTIISYNDLKLLLSQYRRHKSLIQNCVLFYNDLKRLLSQYHRHNSLIQNCPLLFNAYVSNVSNIYELIIKP
ncbi:Hypothetical predicted protein [Octopus vulgaris]|uniref:Uncharacterized protein n=1 Tax=Octopus vulgaris TaxID=6645 RepID=A0AA36AMB7_OCTVU|nr:Hypothetical predicted protein [Octopus vulgaris]